MHPTTPVCVFERENFRLRPVKVKRDIGYLLIEPLQGVA
jgi:hypothetical protein